MKLNSSRFTMNRIQSQKSLARVSVAELSRDHEQEGVIMSFLLDVLKMSFSSTAAVQ